MKLAEKITSSQQKLPEKKNAAQAKKGSKSKGKKQGKQGSDDYLGSKK